jgi:hypothetical protein
LWLFLLQRCIEIKQWIFGAQKLRSRYTRNFDYNIGIKLQTMKNIFDDVYDVLNKGFRKVFNHVFGEHAITLHVIAVCFARHCIAFLLKLNRSIRLNRLFLHISHLKPANLSTVVVEHNFNVNPV